MTTVSVVVDVVRVVVVPALLSAAAVLVTFECDPTKPSLCF